MEQATQVADGYYRLIKLEEDHNPVFPSDETIVEIRDHIAINLLSQREWPLDALGKERLLYGPLSNPYDTTPLDQLPCIGFTNAVIEAPRTGLTADG